MSWLQTVAVVFHVLIATGIVGLVLLQRGRGADAGAGFGAGASGTVFGARGSASFLSRTTAVLAAMFFVSSLVLSYLFSQGSAPTSVVDRVQTEQPAPATTGLPSAPLPQLPTNVTPAPTAAPGTTPATTPAPASQAPAQQAPAAPAQ